jgi:hypothetical protein
VQPSRDFDRHIGNKLFGWYILWDSAVNDWLIVDREDFSKIPLPQFSTDREAAQDLLEMALARGWQFAVKSVVDENGGISWTLILSRDFDQQRAISTGVSIPHAICMMMLGLKEKGLL